MTTAIAIVALNLKPLKPKRDWHDGAEYKLVWAGRGCQTHSDYPQGTEIGAITFASETVWITTKDGKKVLVDAANVDAAPETE